MRVLDFSILAGKVIRGAKEALYRTIEKFSLSIDSPMFGGVYKFSNADGTANFAVKIYIDEAKSFSKFVSISAQISEQSEFVVELCEATRDANGDYQGKEWSVAKGDLNLKIVG